MIVYDGISLDSVANVKVEDIRISPIQYDEVTRPRAIRGGSVFIRSRAGIRTIAITFALLDRDPIRRQSALMGISTWAKNDREYRLEVPGQPEFFLMATCTGKPEPSMRQWWESKLRLVFTCYENPFWNAKAEKSVACGTAALVMGNAEPLMRIERSVTGSAASNQSYALDGKTMTFSTIPVGNMTVDLNNQLAYSENGGTVTDLMQYYDMTGKFLIPRTGNVNISGTGTVYFRERWQ